MLAVQLQLLWVCTAYQRWWAEDRRVRVTGWLSMPRKHGWAPTAGIQVVRNWRLKTGAAETWLTPLLFKSSHQLPVRLVFWYVKPLEVVVIFQGQCYCRSSGDVEGITIQGRKCSYYHLEDRACQCRWVRQGLYVLYYPCFCQFVTRIPLCEVQWHDNVMPLLT